MLLVFNEFLPALGGPVLCYFLFIGGVMISQTVLRFPHKISDFEKITVRLNVKKTV